MHRTTIALEGPVERELRRLAAKEKRSFQELVNDLVKKGLALGRRPSKAEFHWHTADGQPISGFDPADRSTYWDSISRKF